MVAMHVNAALSASSMPGWIVQSAKAAAANAGFCEDAATTPHGIEANSAVALAEQGLGSLDGYGGSVLERALAARHASMSKGAGRPSSHTSVGKVGNE